MTVDEAVKVLNEREHHGHSGWYVILVEGTNEVYGFDPVGDALTEFEAIAVAEKYVRDVLPLPSATLPDNG